MALGYSPSAENNVVGQAISCTGTVHDESAVKAVITFSFQTPGRTSQLPWLRSRDTTGIVISHVIRPAGIVIRPIGIEVVTWPGPLFHGCVRDHLPRMHTHTH
jgi:hypothetical protein